MVWTGDSTGESMGSSSPLFLFVSVWGLVVVVVALEVRRLDSSVVAWFSSSGDGFVVMYFIISADSSW